MGQPVVLSGYLTALALSAMPAFGNFAGGLLAESTRISNRTLSLSLHLAAGIVLGVISIELMPEALGVALRGSFSSPLLVVVGSSPLSIGSLHSSKAV